LGKGRKERTLNIPENFYNKIIDFYKGNTYLFETRNKKRWNNTAFYRELKRQAGKHTLQSFPFRKAQHRLF